VSRFSLKAIAHFLTEPIREFNALTLIDGSDHPLTYREAKGAISAMPTHTQWMGSARSQSGDLRNVGLHPTEGNVNSAREQGYDCCNRHNIATSGQFELSLARSRSRSCCRVNRHYIQNLAI
jgi:hypothetical protein